MSDHRDDDEPMTCGRCGGKLDPCEPVTYLWGGPRGLPFARACASCVDAHYDETAEQPDGRGSPALAD